MDLAFFDLHNDISYTFGQIVQHHKEEEKNQLMTQTSLNFINDEHN